MLKVPLEKLKKRSEFLAASRTELRWISSSFVLQIYPRSQAGPSRYGITASRKIGGAVQRNFAKRRLRSLARTLLPLYAKEGTDYVFIARDLILKLPFSHIARELEKGIKTLHRNLPQDIAHAP